MGDLTADVAGRSVLLTLAGVDTKASEGVENCATTGFCLTGVIAFVGISTTDSTCLGDKVSKLGSE